jgi:AcrR family transcriptional regulator
MRPGPWSAVRTKTTVDHTRVIDVAAALADEHGLDAVTLAMVAGELGLRSQSLYAHVDGIQGLRHGLALRGHALLADRLGHAAMARTGSDALRSVVCAMAEFARQHPGLYQASLRSPGESPAIAAASDRTVAPLMAVLRSFGLEGDDLVHHYRVIWSSVHGFVTLRHAGLMSWPADPDLSFDLMVTMFVHELELRCDGEEQR